MDINPESAISSGYDHIKSEETDDEDMCKNTNTSNNSQNHLLPIINIKEEAVKVDVKTEEDEAITDDEYTPEGLVSWLIGFYPINSEEDVKVEVKTEDEVSTDDEQYSPEYVSSSLGYNPVKSEEADDEELGSSNMKNTDECGSGCGSGMKEPGRRWKSTQDNIVIQGKKEVDESNGSVHKTDRIIKYTTKKRGRPNSLLKRRRRSNGKGYVYICKYEGCNRKAAENGRCRVEHNGYDYCSYEGCTNRALNKKGGVCMRHCAVAKKPKKPKTCKHKGCTNQVQVGGVCTRHGAVRKRYICKHEGCTNQVQKGGVCIKHGAKVKT